MTTIKEFLKQMIESGKPVREAMASDGAATAPVGPAIGDVREGGGDEMNTTTNTASFLATETQLALLEQDFDRAPISAVPNLALLSTIPAPTDEPLPAPAEPTPADFVMPPTSYMHQGRRIELICDGVCVDCARCGMTLTDAVSIERALGPDCSQKGYDEEAVNSDEMQAFIDLAEYPELCNYLTAKYKPLGVRGLMNGLVKIASLNRRAAGLHASICDAIESLGYRRLAASLRDSIAVVEIKESKRDPSCYQVWVKKGEWTYQFGNELKRISGLNQYSRMRPGDNKGVLVPKSAKRGLWEAMLKFYSGYVAKTPAGTIKISRKLVEENKDRPSSPPSA